MQRTLTLATLSPILVAKATYFFFFAAIAALSPFLVLYYEAQGLSGQQIGMLTGVSPLVTIVSASFWGGLADATKQHQRVLSIAIGGVMIMGVTFSIATEFWMLILIVIGMGFFSAPVMTGFHHFRFLTTQIAFCPGYVDKMNLRSSWCETHLDGITSFGHSECRPV